MVRVELLIVAVVEVGTTDGSAKTCHGRQKPLEWPSRRPTLRHRINESLEYNPTSMNY